MPLSSARQVKTACVARSIADAWQSSDLCAGSLKMFQHIRHSIWQWRQVQVANLHVADACLSILGIPGPHRLNRTVDTVLTSRGMGSGTGVRCGWWSLEMRALRLSASQVDQWVCECSKKRMCGWKIMPPVLWHSLVKLCTKNYENLPIFLKVTAKNIVARFLCGHTQFLCWLYHWLYVSCVCVYFWTSVHRCCVWMH